MSETHYEMMSHVLLGNIDRAYKFVEQHVQDGIEVWKTVPVSMGLIRGKDGKPILPPWGTIKDCGIDGVTQQYALTKWLLDHQEDPYSYSTLLMNEQYLKHFHWLANKGVHPGDIHVSLQLHHHMVCHVRAGKRVYEVSPELGERLLHTELRGVTSEDLRLPYEAVYIQIPPAVNVKVWNQQTGWHRAIGCYVVEENYMDAEDRYELEGVDTRKKHRGWRLMMVGENKTDRGLKGDDALSFFRVLLADGTKLDDVIKCCYQDIKRETVNKWSTWTDAMTTDWEQQFRWVMNVILYATWEEPGEHWEDNTELRRLWDRARKAPKGSTKRKRLNERARGLPSQPRIKLGQKLVVDRTRNKSPEKSLEKSGEPSRIRYVKTRVPGHWKAVAHGPKHSLRRQQWIQPYWRNKDAEEAQEQPKHELRAQQ